MADEFQKENFIILRALEKWFIEDIFVHSSNVKKEFRDFVKKNARIEDGLLGKVELKQAERERLKDFLNGKENGEAEVVKHEPSHYLTLASVFLRVGSTTLGGEAIWAAYSLSVSKYARSKFSINFNDHEEKRMFTQLVLEKTINVGQDSVWWIADRCHRCLYQPYRLTIQELQDFRQKIEMFVQKLAEYNPEDNYEETDDLARVAEYRDWLREKEELRNRYY